MSGGVPRLARALLEAVLPVHRRDDVIGDLAEVHARRRRRRRKLAFLLTCADAVLLALTFLLSDAWREPGRPASTRWTSDLLPDVRFALRHLARRPAFAALALGTLGVGVGATLALFIAVHGLLLRPLPYADEAHTVVLWQPGAWRAGELDVARGMRLDGIEALGAYTTAGASLRSGEGSTVVRAGLVFPGTFDVLGAAPLLGRVFGESDHAPGATEAVVVSHGLWLIELGGDSAVVGRSIELDGRGVTVIGVMPEAFFLPDPDVRLWRPLVVDPSTASYAGRSWLTALARLAPESDAGLIARDLARVAAELDARFEYPNGSARAREPATTPIRRHLLGDARAVLLLLLAAVSLLLTAATANVSVLVLARTYDRRGELSVRRSLGAGSARVVRQLLTEGVVLGSLAGGLSVLLGATMYRALGGFLPLGPGFERLPALGWPQAAAAVGVSTGLGALAAAVPTFVLWRGAGDLASGMRARTADARMHRAQAALVIAQVAAALTLVGSATLMARSVGELLELELGLDRSDVLVASVSLAPRAAPERRASYAALLDRIVRVPGVRRAGLISHLPLRDLGWAGPVLVEDRPELRDDAAPFAYFRVATPGALEALGIEVTQGRGFTGADQGSAEAVVLVNRSFAESLWPGADPLGRRIASIGFEGDLWATVIGVVEDVRVDGPAWEPGAVFYRPLAQTSAPAEVALVASVADGGGTVAAAALRREAAAVDPLAAVHRIATMDEVLRQAIRQPMRLRFFLSLLGGLALAVGTAGVFGMVSYAVGRRTREYGIRMALGADARRLVRAEVRRAAATVVLGSAVGVAGALLAARSLRSFLFGVGPADPLSLTGAVMLLLLTGVGAALLPAARAGRVDPLTSLRAE